MPKTSLLSHLLIISISTSKQHSEKAAKMTVTIQSILDAENRISPYKVETALLSSDRLNQKLPFDLFVKADCLQRTGSFKFRGGCNAVFSLDDPARPVLAYSSGNHAQAVALAARLSGRKATIVMPEDAPVAKIEGTRSYGAEVVLYDRYSQSREEIGAQLAKQHSAELIAPFDDERVIAGQGTAGLEIARQLNRLDRQLDVFFCCCGGGGLMAGTSLALAEYFPEAELYTAEPAGFDDTARSLAAGKRLANDPSARSICDAIVTPSPGELTFPIVQKLAAGGKVVSDEAALRAMKTAWDYFKLTVEPGGAVALAAALDKGFMASQEGGSRKTIVAMISGGNCDADRFAEALAADALI